MKTTHPLKNRLSALAVALVGILIVSGLLLAGCGEAGGTREATQGSTGSGSLIDTIIVTGTGKVTTLPDEATIQVGVQNEGTTAAEALDANSKDMQKVLDRLKAEGVADEDIETANVVVYPNTYYDSKSGQEKTTGYRAQNTVTVTFHDLSLIGDVFAAATEAGADNVYGPSWQLSEDNAAVTTALTRAIANARIKAEAIAADQGVQLGEAIIISESSASQAYPLYDERQATGGGTDASVTPPPISPQNMEVYASVTVTYRMIR
jgi:uncharacterized protein YggE